MKNSENNSYDELKRLRRMSYIKMAAMVGFVIAIITFGSIAWFTMNREVEGTGMSMTASGKLFEIQTTGEVANEDINPLGYLKSFLSNNATPKTNDSKDGNIIWLLSTNKSGSEQSNQEKFEYGLSPGSNGELSFTIVPYDDIDSSQDLLVKYTINMTAYTLSPDYVPDDENDEVTFADLQPLPLDSEAVEYIKSHIMLFAGKQESNGAVTYSDRIVPGQEKTIAQFHADASKPVTIHWKWPELFGNITNTTDTGTICTGDDLTSLKNDIIAHPDNYFNRLKDEYLNENGTLINGTLSNLTLTASDLSKAYNNADSVIGRQVKYIFIEVTVNGDLVPCSGHNNEP